MLLRASFDHADTPSFIIAAVEASGNTELVSAFEEEMAFLLMDENAELQYHDAAEQLSDYVDDGTITPEEAVKILADEHANPTGDDIATLVERATSDDGIRYSLADFSTQVDDVLSDNYDKNNHVNMGKTPYRLSKILGINKLPMLITNNHVYTMAVSEAQAKADGKYNKKAHYHDLGAELIKKLPRALDRPVMIIKSNTDTTSADFVVLTDLFDKNGNMVIVAVKPYGQGFYYNIELTANVALSGYGKNNILNYVNTAKKENRILYAYKKYNQQKQNTPGVQFPDTILSADYNNSLSQYKQIVNSQYMQKTQNDTHFDDDGVRYMVIGKNADTADKSMLEVAKYYWDMPGADHSNITRETGWWYDSVDGKWKYEISDSDMKYEPNGLVEDPRTLQDYIEHDSLFSAYPQLKDTKVEFVTFDNSKRNGSYDFVNDTIRLNENRTAEQQKKTLIHEIQHAVQHIEDFATGTNENIAYLYLFNQEYHKVKGTAEFKALSTPDERAEYIEDSIHPDEAKREASAREQYADSHGETESRETAHRIEYGEGDLRNNPRSDNTAPIINKVEVFSSFVDILKKLGYTENEIKKFGKDLGITNDEQRYVSESDISELAWYDRRGRRGDDKTSEIFEPGGRGQPGRVSGRPESLGGSDAGAGTAGEGQLQVRVKYSLAAPDTVSAVNPSLRAQNIIKIAEGLQSVAQSSVEYEALERYKNNAVKLDAEYSRLESMTKELRELNNAETKDADRIKDGR